jgi:hypothetical protein
MNTAPQKPLITLESIDAFLRAIAAAAVAGALAGIVAAGMGGRLAMRITALTAGQGHQGKLTEAEETVGVISLEGTMFLVVILGIGAGLFGGVLYAGLRSWLRDLGAWRGLAFGLFMLGTLGWTVIERDNFDFHEFGYATLNIAMFGMLFVAFGVLVAPLYDAVHRRLPRLTLSVAGLAGILVRVVGAGALILSVALAVAIGGSSGSWAGLLPLYVLLLPPLTTVALTWRTGSFATLDDLRQAPFGRTVAVGVIAVPVALGTILDVRAVVHHLTASS